MAQATKRGVVVQRRTPKRARRGDSKSTKHKDTAGEETMWKTEEETEGGTKGYPSVPLIPVTDSQSFAA
jgi:hypothetical protein